MLHNGALSKLLLPVTLAALVGAPAALANGPIHRPAQSRTIVETVVKVSEPTTINGTTVQPAEYRMVARGDKLKVEDLNNNKKVVAESMITWKRLDHTVGRTKMDIDHGVLTKVELGRTHEAIMLHNSDLRAAK